MTFSIHVWLHTIHKMGPLSTVLLQKQGHIQWHSYICIYTISFCMFGTYRLTKAPEVDSFFRGSYQALSSPCFLRRELVKCMVGWQELSMCRKVSRDSLEPDHTQRMLLIYFLEGRLKGLTFKEPSLQWVHEDVGIGRGHLGANRCSLYLLVDVCVERKDIAFWELCQRVFA